MAKQFPKSMTALCIAQPWVHCIFKKGKNIENRSQNLKKRGTVAIYASATVKLERFDACREGYRICVSPEDVSLGAIVGFVDIVAVIGEAQVTAITKRWFIGDYGYVLENPVLLKNPVSVKPPTGAIKFWDLKGSALRQCFEQLSSSRLARFKPFV